MKSYYTNSTLEIIFIQQLEKFPRYATFFEYPGHLCAIEDITRQYKKPKEFSEILKIKKPYCVYADIAGKNLLTCKDHFKIGDIDFKSDYNYTYKPKKACFSQKLTSDVPCTDDKSENTTLRVNYVCDTQEYDIMSLNTEHKCHYVLRMSVKRMCKYNHKYFVDDPSASDYPRINKRNIYCIEEKRVTNEFKKSITIEPIDNYTI
ncbi:hypothetical protein TVAG_141610 [Trichomonas vaginalis G3]|uniref:MRH domain-containing protein n=1 Tax=Trichomonas vaginalis (strain ATCC PRA-98 / G3) TaxID=412133 RepID=A2G7Q4_TRIV3|nr:hypothetical protein TVAGG3_0105810 [Trichomonas vaginalis G3]EAX86814.1 hypothetical protein TVAG_141610 [Trichomonas vaginalis G3]KAI5544653.1 hypothetical protein TVAGG3_0105810 [Trichomonas vaginalis G3]|eukprot:XP_001299744.1 hypothetical protein [Trichomonas vaginalis G3]